jgi:hypothetical protein
MPVTIDAIRSLSDEELERFIDAGVEEKRARAERHKQETIARIKELAGPIGLVITIGGVRGRPKGGKKAKRMAK